MNAIIDIDEFKLISTNKIQLIGRIYNNLNNSKGLIVVTHGYGEHQGYYKKFSEYFVRNGFTVCTYDLRSHGVSGGKQGHVSSFELFLDDLDAIIEYLNEKIGLLPMYLFGHSMGGSIVLNYLLRRKPQNIKKAIISSPWLKLAFEPPKVKLFMAKIGKMLFPSVPLKGELIPENISRDKDYVERFKNDPLTYDKISPGYFFTIREYGIDALENAKSLDYPILMSHGTDDKITSNIASKEFCDNAGDLCEYVSWKGYKHVVFSEIDMDVIYKRYYDYLVRK